MAKKRSRNTEGLRALGKILQKHRTIKGLSQEQLAAILGAHLDTIGKWERGRALPDKEFWPTIIKELAIPQPDFRDLLAACLDSEDHMDGLVLPKTRSGSPRGFVRVTDGEPIPLSRQRQAARLKQTIAPDSSVIPSLVVIEGRTGVGKTHLVGLWLRDHGAALFGANAVCVDCSTKLIDQIRPAVEEHFALIAPNSGALPLAERLNAVGNSLVVIDGLQFSRSGELISAQTAHRGFQIRELIEGLGPLFDGTLNTCVIVCIENNYRKIRFQGHLNALPANVVFAREIVDPLSDDEGAKFLEDLGVVKLDEHDLQDISRRLHGLPIALSAAALELIGMSGVELEQYADDLLPRAPAPADGAGENEFDRFFVSWLSRSKHLLSRERSVMEGRPEQIDPHPHALLRLLALMPGPVSRAHLEQIVTERRIKRLTRLSVQDVLSREIPFISVVDDHIDLHAAVRRHLRAELDVFINTGMYDAFTRRDELEWIHWRCALLHWRSFASEEVVDSQIVAAIEAFVYHVMEQIRLIPKQAKGRLRQNPRRALGETGPKTIEEFKSRSGHLNDIRLWSMACDRAVRPFLLDRSYVATKVHGQYETKARILTYLTTAVDDYHIAVHQQTLAELYKELALSWMHAGRLKLAQYALSRAMSLVLTDTMRANLSRVDDASKSVEKQLWRLECDLKSLSVTLSMREGRLLDDSLSEVEPYYDAADRILKNLPARNEQLKWTPPLEAGALRILVRKADIALSMGDYAQALFLFDRAEKTRLQVRGRSLDGEAARRYVLALVRNRANDERYLQRAVALVEQNIEVIMSGMGTMANQVSSDVVPFLVLRAGLSRVLGDLDVASGRVKSIRSHDYVRKRECTFAALVELEMEEIRQEIAADGPREVIFARATALARKLLNAHHWVLHFETNLLAAEACEGDTKSKLLMVAKVYFRQNQYRLRLSDIAELEAGRSAVKVLGL